MCILHDVTRKCLHHYHMRGDMSANLIGQYTVLTIDHLDAQNLKKRGFTFGKFMLGMVFGGLVWSLS